MQKWKEIQKCNFQPSNYRVSEERESGERGKTQL